MDNFISRVGGVNGLGLDLSGTRLEPNFLVWYLSGPDVGLIGSTIRKTILGPDKNYMNQTLTKPDEVIFFVIFTLKFFWS